MEHGASDQRVPDQRAFPSRRQLVIGKSSISVTSMPIQISRTRDTSDGLVRLTSLGYAMSAGQYLDQQATGAM